MRLADLEDAGFNVCAVNAARATLLEDFSGPLSELCGLLSRFRISDLELIQGGGGVASQTKRLRRALTGCGWRRGNISFIGRAEAGAVALRIEWNDKSAFFDRDLRAFDRRYEERSIHLGIIITRGSSLQGDLVRLVKEFATDHEVRSLDDLRRFGVTPTARQRRMVAARGESFAAAWARAFVSDKFGGATTHWDKLQERVGRGVGPCPLLLLGIPSRSIEKS